MGENYHLLDACPPKTSFRKVPQSCEVFFPTWLCGESTASCSMILWVQLLLGDGADARMCWHSVSMSQLLYFSGHENELVRNNVVMINEIVNEHLSSQTAVCSVGLIWIQQKGLFQWGHIVAPLGWKGSMAIPAPPGDWMPLQGFSTDLCCWQVTLRSSLGGLGLVGKVHLELTYSLPPCHCIQEPIE